MTTEDELRANDIVKSWFWQLSEGHNFRWKNAVKSITLFYESAPLESDIAQLVLEYLRTRSGITELVVGHKKWTLAESGWNAKDAWYQTAPSEKWAGTESTKIRVYWTLVEAGDGTADGPYVVEDGCKYKVEHSYYWDVAAEPQLPQSESGIQYTIQGFTRDRETGLFTYIVEKRETVQQDIELYESAKTIFEDVSEEQHLGVKQANVASTGLAASVGNGERVERHIEKNSDCTSNIVNRKVKDKKVEEARTVAKKELRGTSSATTDRNLTPAEVAAKTAAEQEVGETRTVEKTDTDYRNLTVEKFTPGQLPMTIAESCEKETSVHTHTKVEAVAPPAQDGTVEQTAQPNKRKIVSIKKNDDGKTADKTTTTQTWTEKTGGGSSNSGNGVVTTTTERKENTLSTPAATPGVNKVVEIEETPNDHGSKTTLKRVTQYQPDSKTATGGTTSRTVTVESGVNQVAVPADAPAVNKEVEVSVSLNDHGSMSTQKRVTEFKPDSKTAHGGTTSRTVTVESGVNQVAVPADAPAVNKEVEVSVSLNDHGSMSTQKRVTEFKPDSKTATGGTTSRQVTVESGVNQVAVPADAPAVNKEVEVSVSLNDHGSMSTQKRVTQYQPDSKTAHGGTTSRTVTVESGVNQVAVPADAPAVNKEVEVSVSLNDHGSMSTQKRVTEYREKTGCGSSNSGGVVSSVTERKENTTTSPAAGASAVNVVVETDEQPNDHGSKTTLKRTTTYSPTTKTKTWSDEHYTYSQCAYSNQPEPLQPSSGETISLNFHPNGHGSYDGYWTTRTSKSSGGVVTLAWEKTINNLTSKYFYFNKEGKLCYRVFTCATAYYCYGPYRSCYNKVYESAGNPPENCAHVGWISGVRMSGMDKAFGQRFSGITAGSEVVVDQDSGSGSSQS